MKNPDLMLNDPRWPKHITSAAYPYLAIANHHGVDYGAVLWEAEFCDQIHGGASLAASHACVGDRPVLPVEKHAAIHDVFSVARVQRDYWAPSDSI